MEIYKLMWGTLKSLGDFLRENFLLVLAGVVLFGWIYTFFWEIPKRQLLENRAYFHSLKEYYELKNGIRTTFAQAFGGAVLLIGLFFTWRNLRISQEGQITERFTKAINQLGESGPEKLAIRLGGIYALERIARDSKRDYWPVMEVLAAYVRENAPKKEEQSSKGDGPSKERNQAKENQPLVKPATDIQAILTVIGRRTLTFETGEDKRLDLSRTNLIGVDLREANLTGIDLRGADLREADLRGADCFKTIFVGKILQRELLRQGGFDESGFDPSGFDVGLVTGADLRGANLMDAKHLTKEQLAGTTRDEKTQIPPELP